MFFPWKEIFVVCVGAVFTGLAFSDLYLKDLAVKSGILEKHFSLYYSVFAIYFCSFILYSLFHLYKKYTSSKGIEREQMKLLLWGLVISYSIGSIFSLLLPILGYYTEPIGPIAPLILVIFVAIAITKHNLMDITVIIGRTAAYVITIVLFGAAYLLLTLAYVNLFSAKVDSGFLGITIIYGILVGEFFQRVRFLVQTTAEKAFLKGRYDYRKVLAKASKSLSNCHNLDDIAQVVESTFKDEMDVAGARVVILKQ